MNISPLTNISSPVSTEQKTIFTDSNAARTVSKDLSSVSTTSPALKVTLSATDNSVAAANTKIPPLYSRPTISETNQNRLRTDEISEGDKTLSLVPNEEGGRVEGSDENSSEDSEEAFARGQGEQDVDARNNSSANNADDPEAKDKSDQRSDEKDPGSTRLTDEEQEIVTKLSARDKEVRAHEQAHKAVGGQYTGAISYDFQSGPDGKRYAVGGEVPIDVSEIPDNPQATISKMQTVKAAALAPAEPSTADRAVAATATRILAEAQADLAEDQREELELAREKSAERREEEPSVDEQANKAAVESFQEIASLDPVDESVVRQGYSIRL